MPPTRLLNLTPHPLALHAADGSVAHLPVHGAAPRCAVERSNLGDLLGMPLVRSTMGAPVGLPDPEPGVYLVVSALVAEHPSLAARTDLVYPGEAIRDESGRVVGARGLCAGPGLARLLGCAPAEDPVRDALRTLVDECDPTAGYPSAGALMRAERVLYEAGTTQDEARAECERVIREARERAEEN